MVFQVGSFGVVSLGGFLIKFLERKLIFYNTVFIPFYRENYDNKHTSTDKGSFIPESLISWFFNFFAEDRQEELLERLVVVAKGDKFEKSFLTGVARGKGKIIVSCLRSECYREALPCKADRWLNVSSLCKMETNTSGYTSLRKRGIHVQFSNSLIPPPTS